jgi:protein TonB
MSDVPITWLEQRDPRDLRRWVMAAAFVLAVHLGAVALYAYLHVPDELGDDAAPVAIELAPVDSDVDQPAVDAQPQQEEQKKVEQPPPPPPDAVAMPEEKPVEKPQEDKPQAAPTPALTKGGAPTVSRSWESDLVKHLQRYKRYPGEAQSRGVEGVVLLAFSVDRNGRVLTHRIVRSSGHPDLDAEVMTMIERAQPLPAFPPSMTQEQLNLTVPIRFSLR